MVTSEQYADRMESELTRMHAALSGQVDLQDALVALGNVHSAQVDMLYKVISGLEKKIEKLESNSN